MKIDLVPMNLREVDSYYALFSSTAVCRFMDICPFQSVDDSKVILDFSLKQKNDRKSFRHSILIDGDFAGTTCLYSIYWHQKRASVGYALREKFWNKGVMSKALDFLGDIAKNEF